MMPPSRRCALIGENTCTPRRESVVARCARVSLETTHATAISATTIVATEVHTVRFRNSSTVTSPVEEWLRPVQADAKQPMELMQRLSRLMDREGCRSSEIAADRGSQTSLAPAGRREEIEWEDRHATAD